MLLLILFSLSISTSFKLTIMPYKFGNIPLFWSSNRPISLFVFLSARRPDILCPSSVSFFTQFRTFRSTLPLPRSTTAGCNLLWTKAHISEANNLYSYLRTPLNCFPAATYIMFVSTIIQSTFFRYTVIYLH
jgi:hypothetical protein